MKHKNLIIALAVAAPAFFIIGCGTTETRSITEEHVLPEETIESMTIDTNEVQPPVEDLEVPVYAEADIVDSANEVNVELVESQVEEITPPTETAFYFATNDSQVKQEDYSVLIAHADYLMKHPEKTLRISGHTDQSGPAEYNQWLAKQRAEAVAKVLIEYGVAVSQIKIESLGETQPMAGLEHAIADRRVELEYSNDTQLSDANSF